jgi:hypothetical protein
MLAGTRIGGVAGDDGRYLIANVPAGRYRQGLDDRVRAGRAKWW